MDRSITMYLEAPFPAYQVEPLAVFCFTETSLLLIRHSEHKACIHLQFPEVQSP